MVSKRFLVSLTAIVFVTLSPLFTAAQTSDATSWVPAREKMAELEAIVFQAPDLKTFLKDKKLQAQYFVILQSYLGPEITQEGYDGLISQLKELIKRVPQLATRLWETDNLGQAFSIKAQLKTSGRNLDAPKWHAYLTQWQKSVAAARGDMANLSEEDFNQKLIHAADGFVQRLRSLEASIARLPKSERTIQMGKFYGQAQSDPVLKQIAARLLNHVLVEDDQMDILDSLDADQILDAVDNLKNNIVREISVPEGYVLPGPLVSALKALIPSKPDLLQKAELFPVAMRMTRNGQEIPIGGGGASEYTFDPIPRRFHGIWKGFPLKECVGGRCTKDLTAERWATVALKGTQFYHLHREDSYLGFIQIVPVKKGNDIYGSVDFGSSALARKIVVKNGAELHGSLLFDLWFDKMKGRLPKGWRGLLVSDSNAINNTGVLSFVWESSKFKWAPVLGVRMDFQRTDPLGSKIIENSRRDTELKQSYGGRMIFDAMARDIDTWTARLRRLVRVSPDLLSHPRKILAALKNGSVEYRDRMLMALVKQPIPNDEIAEILWKLAENSKTRAPNLASQVLAETPTVTPLVIQYQKKIIKSRKFSAVHAAIFEKLDARNDFDPESVELALALLLREGDTTATQVEKYLLRAPLTNDQIDRAWLMAQNGDPIKDLILARDYWPERRRDLVYDWMLTAPLSRRLDMAMAYLKQPSSPDDVRHLLQETVTHAFASNPMIGGMTKEHMNQFKTILSYLGNQDQQKEFLLDLLKSDEGDRDHRRMVTEWLTDYQVTAVEAQTIAERTSRFFDNRGLMLTFLTRLPRPSSEFVQSAFNFHINDKTADSNALLLTHLRSNTTEEEAYLMKLVHWVLDNKMVVGGSPKKILELTRVSEILADGERAIPADVQEAVLVALERESLRSRSGLLGPMFAKFDHEHFDRIQKLYVRWNAAIETTDLDLIRLMPRFSPQFAQLVRGAMELHGREIEEMLRVKELVAPPPHPLRPLLEQQPPLVAGRSCSAIHRRAGR